MPTVIRGEQIKDETIDSIDIATGSIKAAELDQEAISGQPTIAAADTTNDRLLVWDATDSALKQISIGNLGVPASPAGLDTQVQYNNDGVTAGAPKLLYDDSNHRLGIGSTSAPSNTLTAYADASSAYVALIDNDAGSAGHGLKVTSAGTGTGTYLFDVESASTTVFRVRGDGRVGIGKVVALPAAVLTVSSSNADGDIAIAHKIQHVGDSDTYVEFEDDTITLAAGGRNFIKIEEASTDKLTINNGGLDIDLKVSGENQANLIRTDAENDSIYFGGNSATGIDNNFWVSGSIGSQSTSTRGTAVFGGDLVVSGAFGVDGITFVVDESTNKVGIGIVPPKTGLDMHHDPTALADDTGGGECVTFGTGVTTAGKLYYLNGTAWAEIDASAPATGADQMVGIALGTSSADGILIRGFFDAATYLSSFSAGKAVYMSETAASMTTVAPTTAGAIVRIMGYCTDTANVIYFNPSNNWIELA